MLSGQSYNVKLNLVKVHKKKNTIKNIELLLSRHCYYSVLGYLFIILYFVYSSATSIQLIISLRQTIK
jgi:hypothetical protein